MSDERVINEQQKPVLHEHVPVAVVGFICVILILTIIGMFQFPPLLQQYKIYALADERCHKGETYEALTDLQDLVVEYPENMEAILKLFYLSMENGYYDLAADVYDEYIYNESFEDDDYTRINAYFEKLSAYYNVLDAIDSLASSIHSDSDEEFTEAFKSGLQSMLGQNSYDQAVVYYYMAMFEDTLSEQQSDLLQSYTIDENCFDVKTQLSIISRRLNQLVTARTYAQVVLSQQSDDVGGLRAMATIDMVEGDLEEGLTLAEKAYEIDPDSDYIRDTYAIALYLNGQEEAAKSIIDEIYSVDGNIDEDLANFMNGGMTAQEYYIGE